MTRSRFWPALGLAVGLLTSVATSAQPPAVVPSVRPAIEPVPVGRAPQGGAATIPVLPNTAGAFVTLKVSALAEHPELKTALAQLAKQPDALADVTDVIGVSPLDLDRVTLFWPRLSSSDGPPVLVVTTREPFNEARVLTALKAHPVFDSGRYGGRGGVPAERGGVKGSPPAVKSAPSESIPPAKVAPPTQAPPVDRNEVPGAAADAVADDPLYYAMPYGAFDSLFLIDDHTLMFLPSGPEGPFAAAALMVAGLKKTATGPLAGAIAAADKHTLAAGVHLTPLFRQHDRHMPRELIPYGALLSARTAVVTGDLDKTDLNKTSKLNLTLSFDDAAAAKRAAPVLEEGTAAVAEFLAREAGRLKESRRPVESSIAPLVAALSAGLKKTAAKADGNRVTAATEIDAGPAVANALGELLRTVQSRKKDAPPKVGFGTPKAQELAAQVKELTAALRIAEANALRAEILATFKEQQLQPATPAEKPGPAAKALAETVRTMATAAAAEVKSIRARLSEAEAALDEEMKGRPK